MKTQIQLILATVVITVLIWVYADLSSHESYDVYLPVKLVVPPNSDWVVHLDSASADKSDLLEIRVWLLGPKAVITKLRDERERPEEFVLEVEVAIAEGAKVGIERSVDVTEHVNEWARKKGLLVENLSRQSIEYSLDKFVEVEISVEADPGIYEKDLEGLPRVEPASVQARLLASQRDRLHVAPRPLILPISSELEKLETRTNTTFEKPLVNLPWQGLNVTYTPKRVTVTVEWRSGGKRQPISAIPLQTIWPADPPEGYYRVVWDNEADLVQHIDVIIPPGKPRPLTNMDVKAYVNIEREDFPVGPTGPTETPSIQEGAAVMREVRFIFPPGFEDVRVVSQPEKVRFHLKREDIAAP